MTALSIRQPWAWLIANGYKDVENRKWRTNFRGPVLIHAGKSSGREDYDAARMMIEDEDLAVELPEFGALERGGIVGQAEILDCVTAHASPWFVGEFGFVLANAKPLPFEACPGQLGFFRPVRGDRPDPLAKRRVREELMRKHGLRMERGGA